MIFLKLNKIIYNKLLLQAEEAKDRKKKKLANAIFYAIGSMTDDENKKYLNKDMEDDIYQLLWKMSAHVIKRHNLESVDADKLNKLIENLTPEIIDQIESALLD